jgi:hypothetical protein
MKFRQVTGYCNTILWYYLFVPGGMGVLRLFQRERLLYDMSGKTIGIKLFKY